MGTWAMWHRDGEGLSRKRERMSKSPGEEARSVTAMRIQGHKETGEEVAEYNVGGPIVQAATKFGLYPEDSRKPLKGFKQESDGIKVMF